MTLAPVTRILPCALLLVGCHGEEVESPSTDAATSEIVSEATADIGSSCAPAGNFFVDSGAGGWSRDGATIEPIAGPCSGWGYRFQGGKSYSSVTREVFKSLKAGTRLVVRVYFKASGAGGPPPSLLVRARHYDDAGEVRTDVVDMLGDAGADWKLLEARGTLAYDETSLAVSISSTSPTTDEFAFGGVSVVTE